LAEKRRVWSLECCFNFEIFQDVHSSASTPLHSITWFPDHSYYRLSAESKGVVCFIDMDGMFPFLYSPSAVPSENNLVLPSSFPK
jgi:hypothetical protein